MASSEHFFEEQFISEEDLKKTELLLKKLKSFQPNAVSHYKAWVYQRKKSIEAIDCLQNKLETLHWGCNVAHGVGSAMEVVGGLAMLAGTFLTASGHKSSGEFLTKKVSPVSTATGIAATLTSSLAELGLTHTTMEEVKMVLEKDEKYTKILIGNLERSKEIDLYLSRIFSCSILSNTFLDVVQLCRDGISLLDIDIMETSELMNELKFKALECNFSVDFEAVIRSVYATMKKISADPEVRKALGNICDIIQQSPSSVEFIKLGLKISIEVCDILKMDFITSVFGYGTLKACIGVIPTRCLLGTVLVAVNVFSVISALQDAKEGDTKYSKMLKDLKQALTMELNTVRKNYPELL